MKAGTTRPRIRTRLLVLLWIWAACVFTTLDLFRNAPALDRFRPDARWYRAARFAAHRMVDEPWLEQDEFAAAYREPAVRARLATPAAETTGFPRPPTRLRVVAGAPPDAETARLLAERIRGFAGATTDPVRRAAAERSILRITTRERQLQR